jgi:hypothetical protein
VEAFVLALFLAVMRILLLLPPLLLEIPHVLLLMAKA